MSLPSPRKHLKRALTSDEGGAVLVFVAVGLVVFMGFAGIAIDLGRGYLERSQMSRAVDAGVLAGARSLRSGITESRRQAFELARANGLADDPSTSVGVDFGTNAAGERTVTMTASRTVPTTFIRLLGRDQMNVGSRATAAVPPVDLVLVLDQSGSLSAMGAWNDLQEAAKQFVSFFDDNMDQMGLVSFQVRGTNRFPIDHGFTSSIRSAIDGMSSAGDTNAGEGLRLALEQMRLPGVRDRSAKVVVFFTDGRPTAFRGVVGPGGPSDGGSPLGPFTWDGGNPNVDDRMMAVQRTRTGGQMRGYFDDPETLPTDRLASPDGCVDATSCWGWQEPDIRERSREAGLVVADAIREDGVFVYTIGLGDPSASTLEQPDLDYLAELANESGQTDSSQPAGQSYFAPDVSQLQDVFDQVAQDLLVRLAQ
ncbi:MAG: VWA domain-containing protein [Gemmatimonadota bacterium]